MREKKKLISLLGVLMIFILILTACVQEEAPAMKGAAPAEGSLLDGVPEPENAQYQSDNPIQEGGMHGYYTSDAAPPDIIEAYNSSLESNGWTIQDTGGDPFGAFGANTKAIQGGRYLYINAGGPGGTTYIDICVWPQEPNDNNCGQNQDQQADQQPPVSEGVPTTGGAANGSLLDGVPEPENAQYQSDNPIQEGGMHGYYTSNAAPPDVIEPYNTALEANGWTIENTGGDPFGVFGANTTATQGGRYLYINAGGPGGGNTFIDICVWPQKPNDNNCGQNQNNNALKGAALPSEDAPSGLLAGVPEPENATYQATDSIQEGGLHGFYTSNAAPPDVIEPYNKALEENGWTIEETGGDPFGAFGANTKATQGDRYLYINAGGPGGGNTFIDICVWPQEPNDNNCGQNQDQNNNNNNDFFFKGSAATESEDTLLMAVPELQNATEKIVEPTHEAGIHGYFQSDNSPMSLVEDYQKALEENNWTIVDSGGGGDPFGMFGGGAGLTATYSDGRYLKMNAGGPAGATFIDICVWPQEPQDNNCGQDNNNNNNNNNDFFFKGSAATEEDALLHAIPELQDAEEQVIEPTQEAGVHGFFKSTANPMDWVADYQKALEENDWTIVDSGGGGDPFGFGGGAGLTATYEDGRYLVVNAGGPAGMTFIDICVWPQEPQDNNCGQDNNNN